MDAASQAQLDRGRRVVERETTAIQTSSVEEQVVYSMQLQKALDVVEPADIPQAEKDQI